MVEVNDKVVFLTGGANGIGATVVKDFLQRSAKFVAFLDIDKNSGLKLEKELGEIYGKDTLKFIECDVTNDEQLKEAYNIVIKNKGYIDLIINNAAIAIETVDNYKKLIDVNFKALVTSSLKGLELMRKDQGGKGGTIINISSIAALLQMAPTYFVYFATKSAILQFSSCIGLQNYYNVTGVRIITICFGCTETDLLRNMTSFDPIVDQLMAPVIQQFPLQSVESASRGLVEVYEKGDSGDTWLVYNNKPPLNITPRIKKAYEILSEGLLE